jgi:hypothetical protein
MIWRTFGCVSEDLFMHSLGDNSELESQPGGSHES